MRQVELEREAVGALYRRLDEELAEARTAYGHALAAPVDSPSDLYARDVEVARLARTTAELRAAERALCFGRVDPAGGGSFYIGRIGLRDEDADAPQLVDWRADAARPFYAATAASPMGLRRRRHLRLAGRRVVGVTDEVLDGSAPGEEDVVGDGPLVEVLGQARTGRMREAVATLQAEQDAIVRSPHRGVTVVEGGPGTGKTVVALHRAAYVLYAHRHIARRGVLFFGPNRRFLDYVSDVLPSLGENDVLLATAADLVGTTPGATEPRAVARLKGRAGMAAGLARWVRDRQPHGTPLAVELGPDAFVLDAQAVDRARRRALRDGHGHNPARDSFKEHVVDDLLDLVEKRAAEALDDIDAEVASVLDVDLDGAVAEDLRALGLDDTPASTRNPEFDRDRVRAALADDPGVEEAVESVWPRLRAADVLRRFLADRAALAGCLPRLADDEVALLVRPRDAAFTHADLALLDEVRELVDGPPERTFGHVVVDEAQELTGMEWRMVMRRCPSRSMTVAGDFAQAGSATTIRSWSAALAPFVGTRFERHTLTVNYRTTAEVLEAAAPLLARLAPGREPARSIRRGDPPRTVDVAEDGLVDSVVRHVRDQAARCPGELIGVVAAAGRTAALAEALDGTGAAVVAAPEVRGLEYDTVVVVDPAAIEAARDTGTRDLYVAVTRAGKRLWLFRPRTA